MYSVGNNEEPIKSDLKNSDDERVEKAMKTVTDLYVHEEFVLDRSTENIIDLEVNLESSEAMVRNMSKFFRKHILDKMTFSDRLKIISTADDGSKHFEYFNDFNKQILKYLFEKKFSDEDWNVITNEMYYSDDPNRLLLHIDYKRIIKVQFIVIKEPTHTPLKKSKSNIGSDQRSQPHTNECPIEPVHEQSCERSIPHYDDLALEVPTRPEQSAEISCDEEVKDLCTSIESEPPQENKNNKSHLIHVKELPEDCIEITSYGKHEFDNLFFSPSTYKLYQQYKKRIRQIEIKSAKGRKGNGSAFVRSNKGLAVYISIKKLKQIIENKAPN